MIRMLLAVFLVMLAQVGISADGEFEICATVTGADPGRGRVMANLFDSKKSYMRAPAAQAQAVPDKDGIAHLDFGEHAPGEYAITVVYDENDNGKLDTGFMRIPKERIGYSNNARGRFGPAKWKNTRFMLGEEDLYLNISLYAIRAKKEKDPG